MADPLRPVFEEAGAERRRTKRLAAGAGGPSILCRSEKYQQLLHRHPGAFIRHVLKSLRQRTLSAPEAADQLGLSRSRLYVLFSSYLDACAHKNANVWTPGGSGGDLLRKRLACSPPCPYSFAASEVLRLHNFKLDRAQARHWALQNGYAHRVPARKPLAPVRRWQRSQIGELWQLDASPHHWFPLCAGDFPMLNMLDDCSRLFTGSKLYERELLLSYLDFLPTAFLAYGRPLQLYVDYHSIFFTKTPDALTQLGAALGFYDISFLYAPTPQAKGKIEREHQFWQKRLPPYFASERIADLSEANRHVQALRLHRNAKETHRELKLTAQRAWDLAKQEKRSVLRPAPRCPWWPYVWSVRTLLKTGTDGRIPIGAQRIRLEHPKGAEVVLCLHPSGHHSVLAAPPDKNHKPALLFTNRPK